MPKLLRAWQAHGLHPLRSGVGAALGIALTALIGTLMARTSGGPFLLASLGASAVLAFAVPASPLAQPRAIIGGNIVSALAGVGVVKLLPAGLGNATIPLALGAAILLMHFSRTLHPPGGAVALTAVMGGPAIVALGWRFVLSPVAVNSLVLVGAAWVFNNLAGSRYPHRPEVLPEHRSPAPPAYSRADLDAVLAELEDLPDVAADDLDAIFRAVSARVRQQSL